MPTKNPRLTITLSEDLAWQLRKLSELTGQSQSGLISSLLEGSNKVLWRIIAVLEKAEEAKRSMPGHVTGLMREAQGRIESKLGLVRVLDEAQARSAARRPTSAAAGSPAAAADRRSPPLSNRGGRSKPKRTKSSRESRG